MSINLTNSQIPEKSILDLNGRQVYLGNSFVSGTMSASLGVTTETPYFLFTNPANSGKSAFIYTRKHSIIVTTAAICTFRYYVAPTVTSAGTAITPKNLRLNAGSPASVMQTSTLPTTSNNGTFAADVASTSSGNADISHVLVIVDPGNSVLITATESSGTAPIAFEAVWYELPYGTVL